MNRTIIIATTNAGKLKEFREMLEPRGYSVLSLKDLPGDIEIDENGTTFSENAVIKAQTVTDVTGHAAIADDSGLEIDAFGKEPGVHSARWLGHDTSYDYKNSVILERMKGVQDRTCRYVCAIAWTRPGKDPVVIEENVECTIAYEPKGTNGFGYDPVVYYPPLGRTMAEMTPEEKHGISHRGKAVRKLEKMLDEEDS